MQKTAPGDYRLSSGGRIDPDHARCQDARKSGVCNEQVSVRFDREVEGIQQVVADGEWL